MIPKLTSYHQRPPTIRWITIALIIGGSIIITRLIYLQINIAPYLFHKSQKNYLRTETTPSPRGNIYDRYGSLLATNRPVISLVWAGTGNKKLSHEQEEALNTLEHRILSASIASREAIVRTERQRRRYLIREDISFDQLSLFLELFPNHPNIVIHSSFQRFYPHAITACHVLGYIGDLSLNQHGVMGLEKVYDNTLRGKHGQLLTTINSVGYPLHTEKIDAGLPGDDIYTTIDLELQQLAETCFPAEYDGTIIVMDSNTGALRVVLSRPHFDPNIFVKPVGSEEWKALISQSCFINRAFSACYPPASLFKLVTLLAGLSTNLISTHETWYCPGYTLFCGRRYHCNNRIAHGAVTIQSALAQSCNTPFFDIGRRIRVNTLAHYAHMLGLGSMSNSLFNEKQGLVPTTHWKMATRKEPWWPGETLSVAIGQGFLLATPIQLCVMVNTICRGMMVTPHLTEEHYRPPTQIPIKTEHLAFIKDLMQQVVTVARGTGHHLSQLHGMKIYAKTGTAQTCALQENAPLTKKTTPHGWFTAHVEYKKYEPFTMIVFIEHSGSSKIAAHVTKTFLNGYRTISDRRAKVSH